MKFTALLHGLVKKIITSTLKSDSKKNNNKKVANKLSVENFCQGRHAKKVGGGRKIGDEFNMSHTDAWGEKHQETWQQWSDWCPRVPR